MSTAPTTASISPPRKHAPPTRPTALTISTTSPTALTVHPLLSTAPTTDTIYQPTLHAPRAPSTARITGITYRRTRLAPRRHPILTATTIFRILPFMVWTFPP